MDIKNYKRIRLFVIFFVSLIVGTAVESNNYLLSLVGVLTGMIFMILARSKAKIKKDERDVLVQEKAARITYAIFAPTLGIGAFLMLFPSNSRLTVFSKGNFEYLGSLGMVFAYLTLYLITIYAISFFFINKKYGGGSDGQ